MHLANILSRAYLKHGPSKQGRTQYKVINVDVPPSPEKDWRTSNSHCCKWNSLTTVANNPTRKLVYEIPKCPFIAPFTHLLAVDDGIVMRNTKIFVRTSLRIEYIKQLHKNHLDADSTTRLAGDYFYWPKIEEDIHFHVNKCSACNSTK